MSTVHFTHRIDKNSLQNQKGIRESREEREAGADRSCEGKRSSNRERSRGASGRDVSSTSRVRRQGEP